jgi:S-adenosylmethionine hydrolase
VLIHVIADFGVSDLAFAEVTQQLLWRLPEARVVATPVPPFATLAAGFLAAQLAAAPAPPQTLVFVNVAPRRDNRAGRVDNDGERLLYAELPSGVRVVGVDAGEGFSFVAEAATTVRALDWPTRGSQFRSRDIFPEALARIARGERALIAAPAQVPPVPEGRVAYVDGFGNLKTTWRWGALPTGVAVGSPLQIAIAGRTLEGYVSDGVFGVPEGSLAVAPGSSGYPLAAGGAVRWVEVFLRGASAAEAFGGVRSGDVVALSAGA